MTPQYLSVRLEEKVTQEFLVNVNYGSSQPGKGYEVGSQTASPEKVKITGPKSLVNKIDKVNATVDVDGRTKDFSEEAELNIIDKNQDSLAGRMAYLTIDNTKAVSYTHLYSVLQENPYRLADDISGVGFKIADTIASRIGIHADSDYRIRSGMMYTLLQASGEGHVYLCLLYTSRCV